MLGERGRGLGIQMSGGGMVMTVLSTSWRDREGDRGWVDRYMELELSSSLSQSSKASSSILSHSVLCRIIALMCCVR